MYNVFDCVNLAPIDFGEACDAVYATRLAAVVAMQP